MVSKQRDISVNNKPDFNRPVFCKSPNHDSTANDTISDESGDQHELATLAPINNDFTMGDWLIEPSCNQISHKHGHKTYKNSLEPRLMHLLTYLAANPGRVLSRNELTAEIWPRVIVNENSLTRAVSELRKQLNVATIEGVTTQAMVASYIDTIPKKGYRLTVTIAELDGQHYSEHLNKAAYNRGVEEISGNQFTARLGRQIAARWQPNSMAASFALAVILSISQFLPWSQYAMPEPGYSSVIADVNVTPSDPFMDAYSDNYFHVSANSLSASAVSDNVARFGALGEILNNQTNAASYSMDGKLVAYIEFAGTYNRIVVGSSDQRSPMVEVFAANPDQVIFNLQWSPVGDALLFARKTGFSTANFVTHEGLYDNHGAELVMLDLGSRQIIVLYNEIEKTDRKMQGHI